MREETWWCELEKGWVECRREAHSRNMILQYIHVLNYYFVHLELLQCYMSIISVKLGWGRRGGIQVLRGKLQRIQILIMKYRRRKSLVSGLEMSECMKSRFTRASCSWEQVTEHNGLRTTRKKHCEKQREEPEQNNRKRIQTNILNYVLSSFPRQCYYTNLKESNPIHFLFVVASPMNSQWFWMTELPEVALTLSVGWKGK